MVQLSLFDDEMSISNGQPDFDASIRRVDVDGETFFSLVDVMAFFVGEPAKTWGRGKKAGQEKKLLSDPRVIWQYTKRRLDEDGFQLSDKIIQLKLTAKDGKQRLTDCATGQTVLRIVQSIPSPKAEPIREWLAQLGYERLEERVNPQLGIDRATERYATTMQHRYGVGYNEALEAAIARLKAKVTRNSLTDAMKACIAGAIYYGKFTNIEYRGLFNMTAAEMREVLDGKPRDTMTPEALSFVYIAETTCIRMLRQRPNMTFDEACELMSQIANSLGFNIRELESITGIQLLTGQPVLTGGAS